MDNQKLYHEFYKAYCSTHPEKDGKLCQIEANNNWKKLKEGAKSSFNSRVNESLKELTKLSKGKKGENASICLTTDYSDQQVSNFGESQKQRY